MINIWSSLKTSALISLTYAGIGSLIFSFLDAFAVTLNSITLESNIDFIFRIPILWLISATIFSVTVSSIPALIGGTLIQHFSNTDILVQRNLSYKPSLWRGLFLGGSGSLLISFPILLFEWSLGNMNHYINSPYHVQIIRPIEALIIACIVGALAGKKIHSKNLQINGHKLAS